MYNMGGNFPPRHGPICGQRANWILSNSNGADAALIQIPRRPGDICDACRHGWIHHWREGRAPYHAPTEYLNRGGNEATACGGFYSVRYLHFHHLAYLSNRATHHLALGGSGMVVQHIMCVLRCLEGTRAHCLVQRVQFTEVAE